MAAPTSDPPGTPAAARKRDRTLTILFVARVVNALAFTAAFPFLAPYLKADRGLAATLVGLIYTLQGVVGASFQVVGGVLADRYGRRRVMVTSLLVRCGVATAIGVSVHQVAPVWVVAGLIVLNAAFAGIFQPAADALVVDRTSGDDRLAAFAQQRIAINVGWAIGPILGGLVAGGVALELLFFTAVPLVAFSAWLLSRLDEPTVHQPVDRASPLALLGETFSDRTLRWQLLGALLTFTLAGQMIVTLAVDGAERLQLTRQEIGALWTLNGVLVVALQMPVARFVERRGVQWGLLTGSVVYAVGYAAFGFATSWGHLAAFMVIVTLGELMNAPSQQSAVAARAGPEEVGRALGLLGLVTMLGRSLGPLIGGLAHDTLSWDPRLMWGAIATFGLAAALIYALRPVGRPGRTTASDASIAPAHDD